MKWYLKVLSDYFNFSGRARRKEYWMFALFSLIFAVVAMILDNIFGTTFKLNGAFGDMGMPYGYIYMIYGLALFIPSLSVLVRRLHDTDKSGWFFFIIFIPLIGGIWMLVQLCLDGTVSDNKYGPNPKLISNVGISDPTTLDGDIHV